MAPLAKRNQWQSPERDAAVLAARDEKDSAKRVQMYKDLQKMALDEGPYVIMFQQNETARSARTWTASSWGRPSTSTSTKTS